MCMLVHVCLMCPLTPKLYTHRLVVVLSKHSLILRLTSDIYAQ